VEKKKHLQARPIPSKFYVSKGWKAGEAGDLSQHEHSQQLDQMILAGPFNSRNEAENWNTQNANGHACIWQR